MRLRVARGRWRGLPAWLCGMTVAAVIVVAGRAGAAGETPASSVAVADPFRWSAAAAGAALAPAHTPAPRDAPPVSAAPAASSAHAMRQLRLIGIVRQSTRAVALLSVGGAVLPVRAGQRIGASDGMGGGVVSRVDDSRVHIQWPYQDADGHWKAVGQTLTLDEAVP